MKTFEKSLIMGLMAAILLSMVNFHSRCESISQKVLRLHILANSDTAEDQSLKLKVRDRLLTYSSGLFERATTKDHAKEFTRSYISKLEDVAKEEIESNGYRYPVRIELVNMYFTTRQYDNNITFPAGNYDAIRVIIGEGSGKNWWCVMFPGLCLSSVSQETPRAQNDVLNASEIELIEGGDRYELKFKVVEWIEEFKNAVESMFRWF